MNETDRAVASDVEGLSMLPNLMTAAVAYAVERGVSLEDLADACTLLQSSKAV